MHWYWSILPFQQQKAHLSGSVYNAAVHRMGAVLKISGKRNTMKQLIHGEMHIWEHEVGRK